MGNEVLSEAVSVSLSLVCSMLIECLCLSLRSCSMILLRTYLYRPLPSTYICPYDNSLFLFAYFPIDRSYTSYCPTLSARQSIHVARLLFDHSILYIPVFRPLPYEFNAPTNPFSKIGDRAPIPGKHSDHLHHQPPIGRSDSPSEGFSGIRSGSRLGERKGEKG